MFAPVIRHSRLVCASVLVLVSACSSMQERPIRLNADDRFLLDMSTLHANLALTPAQEPAWERAQSTTGQMLRQNTLKRNTMKEQLRTTLNDPKVDLKPLADRINANMTEQTNSTRDVLDRWLALDAALSAPQKETLRNFLHEKLEQMEEYDTSFYHRRNKYDRKYRSSDDDERCESSGSGW